MSQEKKLPLHRERLNLPDKEAVEKEREKHSKQLKSDMNEVFNSPAGRRVLKHFMGICGYKRQKVGGNPSMGMDILEGTFYNCVREQVLLEFIEAIPEQVKKDCEFGVFEDLLEQ
jgi:hypothetical protein